jgi:D-glycero-D-manno-heptose 1,7-bisphosphate phosphatase
MRETTAPALTVAFLDRDGTINVRAADDDYITDPDELVLLPRAADAIRALNDAGVVTVVVTNQRGIARGRMTEADLARIHVRLAELLVDAADARLDLILHCPHERDSCRCRKPQPGMLEQAERRLGTIDRETSVIIGDAPSDIEAGTAFGIGGMLLGREEVNLYEAVTSFLTSVTS